MGCLDVFRHQGLQQVEWTQARVAGAVAIDKIGSIPYERALNQLPPSASSWNLPCRQLSIAHYFGFDDLNHVGIVTTARKFATSGRSSH